MVHCLASSHYAPVNAWPFNHFISKHRKEKYLGRKSASSGVLAKKRLTVGLMSLAKTKTRNEQGMDLSHLRQSIERANHYHSQLVVVIGKSASQLLEHAASADDLFVINLSLELSEKLIDIPRQDRSKLASTIFTDLLDVQQTKVLLLNHVEVLFDRTLSIDPLRLLQSRAKNLTLVIAWPGDKSASSLNYAIPSHSEYRSYKVSELGETIFVDADKIN